MRSPKGITSIETSNTTLSAVPVFLPLAANRNMLVEVAYVGISATGSRVSGKKAATFYNDNVTVDLVGTEQEVIPRQGDAGFDSAVCTLLVEDGIPQIKVEQANTYGDIVWNLSYETFMC